MTGLLINTPAGTMEGVLYLLQAVLLVCLLEDRRRLGLSAALMLPTVLLLLSAGALVIGAELVEPLRVHLALYRGPSLLLTCARIAAVLVVAGTAISSRRSPERAVTGSEG